MEVRSPSAILLRLRFLALRAQALRARTHADIQRTGWDSNPRGREPTRFPIVRLKPLGHPSLYQRCHQDFVTRALFSPNSWLARRGWDLAAVASGDPRCVASHSVRRSARTDAPARSLQPSRSTRQRAGGETPFSRSAQRAISEECLSGGGGIEVRSPPAILLRLHSLLPVARSDSNPPSLTSSSRIRNCIYGGGGI